MNERKYFGLSRKEEEEEERKKGEGRRGEKRPFEKMLKKKLKFLYIPWRPSNMVQNDRCMVVHEICVL